MHIPLRAATSYYQMCLRIQYSINNSVSAIYNHNYLFARRRLREHVIAIS